MVQYYVYNVCIYIYIYQLVYIYIYTYATNSFRGGDCQEGRTGIVLDRRCLVNIRSFTA